MHYLFKEWIGLLFIRIMDSGINTHWGYGCLLLVLYVCIVGVEWKGLVLRGICIHCIISPL